MEKQIEHSDGEELDIDFESNPVKDAAHEAALQAAGDRLFRGAGPRNDDIEFGEEFDENGDLIEETDEEMEEIGEPVLIPTSTKSLVEPQELAPGADNQDKVWEIGELV